MRSLVAVRDRFFGKEPVAFKNGEHLDCFVPHTVDDPVRAPEHLADVLTVGVLGHDAPGERHLGRALDVGDETVDPAHRGDGVVGRDVVTDGREVVLGLVGPVDVERPAGRDIVKSCGSNTEGRSSW